MDNPCARLLESIEIVRDIEAIQQYLELALSYEKTSCHKTAANLFKIAAEIEAGYLPY